MRGSRFVNRCRNLDGEAFERRNEEPHIVIIDSLDEHPMRTRWWEIGEKLFDKGWHVLHGHAGPRLEHHKLGDKTSTGGCVPDAEWTKHFQWVNENEDSIPWNRFTGKEWDLTLNYRTQTSESRWDTLVRLSSGGSKLTQLRVKMVNKLYMTSLITVIQLHS